MFRVEPRNAVPWEAARTAKTVHKIEACIMDWVVFNMTPIVVMQVLFVFILFMMVSIYTCLVIKEILRVREYFREML